MSGPLLVQAPSNALLRLQVPGVLLQQQVLKAMAAVFEAEPEGNSLYLFYLLWGVKNVFSNGHFPFIIIGKQG